MLAVSRDLNPECEHFEGDMRTVRLGRTFDAVFVHDAVVYMTTEADLRKVIETVFVHLRPGGAAVLAPDYVAETFAESSDEGGEDGVGDGASMRWIEWVFDPDPSDTTYEAHYCGMIREGGKVRPFHDVHLEGLFPRATWHELLRSAGFTFEVAVDEWRRDLIVARKPSGL